MIDRQIDELYQLPLAQFTAARNALAKSLKGADAARVKGLEKPTVVPWAINQVYWRERALYDRLMRSGSALRTAQIAALEGKKVDLRGASEAHRTAVAAVVERAVALAAEHGAKPAPDPLARMLEAVSLAVEPPAHPGRLTDVVQPAGFEALTGVAPRAISPRPAAVRQGVPPAKAAPPAPVIDRAAMRRAEEERKRKQAAIDAAQRTLDRARAAEEKAQRALEDAQTEVRDAERALFRAIQAPKG